MRNLLPVLLLLLPISRMSAQFRMEGYDIVTIVL